MIKIIFLIKNTPLYFSLFYGISAGLIALILGAIFHTPKTIKGVLQKLVCVWIGSILIAIPLFEYLKIDVFYSAFLLHILIGLLCYFFLEILSSLNYVKRNFNLKLMLKILKSVNKL